MQTLDLAPRTQAGGTVNLPGSKSISNRTLLLAALAQGNTHIHGLLDSDDTRVMLTALAQLDVQVRRENGAHVIAGAGGAFQNKQAALFLGNAGTAFRPLTAALAFMGGHYELSGVPRMHERPIADLVDALNAFGCKITYLANKGYPPLRIAPHQPFAQSVIHTQVRGDVSSQFLTALLMAAPLTQKEVVIEVVGELISKPYIDITLNLMQRFGVIAQREEAQNTLRYRIPARARFLAVDSIEVEGDASSASYFLAAGALGASAAPLRVVGAGKHSIQGDVRFANSLAQMGVPITWGDNWIEVHRPMHALKAISADFNHIPDAAMTIAVLALFADGTSTLRNIASWRVKETDRIFAMATELRKLGAQVEEGADYLKITPPQQWQAATIDTYDDHRMAMCFSLASFGGVPVRINDPGCVAKTFPDYFEVFNQLTH